MRILCKDLDAMLYRWEERDVKEALSIHADACPSCAERIRQWDEISRAAQSLHREWDSPDLWAGVQRSLVEESQRMLARAQAGRWRLIGNAVMSWPALAASSALLIFSLAIGWILVRNYQLSVPGHQEAQEDRRLLTEKALQEIEASEAAYRKSIDKLAGLAQPELEAAGTPLMMSYREKLLLIDSAIADCRAGIERNPFNAHLRRELLSAYKEKERTLRDLTREYKNEQH